MQTQPAPASPIALVLGITGGAGGAIARALLRHGWQVRALTRSVTAAEQRFAPAGSVRWIAGDAMNARDVAEAAVGCAAIIHAVNPPGYKNWRELSLPMLQNSLDAAALTGARLVMPGNIYNFAPDAGESIDEAAPQAPVTRKGAIRVEMERMISDAAARGVKSLIVRAGDFFGAGAASWFNLGMVAQGKPVKSVTYPGDRDKGHAWAYLPDLAETVALLLARADRLADCDSFHFAGHYLSPGDEMAHSVARVIGNPNLPIKSLPWIVFYLAAPFVTFMREALEMRYLWRKSLGLNNAKLTAFLGYEPHTPLDQAVAETLTAIGCTTPQVAQGQTPLSRPVGQQTV